MTTLSPEKKVSMKRSYTFFTFLISLMKGIYNWEARQREVIGFGSEPSHLSPLHHILKHNYTIENTQWEFEVEKVMV